MDLFVIVCASHCPNTMRFVSCLGSVCYVCVLSVCALAKGRWDQKLPPHTSHIPCIMSDLDDNENTDPYAAAITSVFTRCNLLDEEVLLLRVCTCAHNTTKIHVWHTLTSLILPLHRRKHSFLTFWKLQSLNHKTMNDICRTLLQTL